MDNSTSSGILLMDTKGNIIEANEAIQTICGYSRKELLGNNFNMLFTAEDRQKKKPEKELFKVISEGSAIDENYLRIKNGDFVWVTGESVLDKDRKLIIKNVFNINKQKELEFQLKKKLQLLNEQKKHKNDFLSFVSHELKTPLAVIKSYRYLLKEAIQECNFKAAQQYFDKVDFFFNAINRFAGDLHDISKTELGKFDIYTEPFNYEEFINSAVETDRNLYPSHTFKKQGIADVMVNADMYRIKQVLNNYVSNAVKYAAGSKKVVIALKVQKDKVITSVKDFGIGIPENKIKKLFNRLYRAHKEKPIEGLGVGLYLSKEIISAHGGEVWVESEEGKGSTFYFSLPIISIP
jgi:PAS domain S-box-containing protein